MVYDYVSWPKRFAATRFGPMKSHNLFYIHKNEILHARDTQYYDMTLRFTSAMISGGKVRWL